jgi:hypothetical protein
MNLRILFILSISFLVVGCAKNSDLAKLKAQVAELQKEQSNSDANLQAKIDAINSEVREIRRGVDGKLAELRDNISTLNKEKTDISITEANSSDIHDLQTSVEDIGKRDLKENLGMRVYGLEQTKAEAVDLSKLDLRILDLEESIYGPSGSKPIESQTLPLQDRVSELEDRVKTVDALEYKVGEIVTIIQSSPGPAREGMLDALTP